MIYITITIVGAKIYGDDLIESRLYIALAKEYTPTDFVSAYFATINPIGERYKRYA